VEPPLAPLPPIDVALVVLVAAPPCPVAAAALGVEVTSLPHARLVDSRPSVRIEAS
jgi:hypothetical protein